MSGTAETPAAQRIFSARMVSPVASSTSPCADALTRVAVRTCTPRRSNWRRALSARSGGKCRQNTRRRLDQNDARVGGVDAAEVALQHRARQLGKRAGQLHAGRPAADDDNGQQLARVRRVGLVLGFLKGQQDPAADAQRVLEGLQAGRKLLPFRVAEVAGATAQREHEIIVDSVFSSSSTLRFARLKSTTWSSNTVTSGRSERMERIGCAISGAERPAVATW